MSVPRKSTNGRRAVAATNGSRLNGFPLQDGADDVGNGGRRAKRGDWTDFRDPARIPARAGAKREDLPRLAVKELSDNAYDAASSHAGVSLGLLNGDSDDGVTFFVADDGPGIQGTSDEIAELFSILRGPESSKRVRLPKKGLLGNGLRVVTGLVLISGGCLRVSTLGRTLTLRPRYEDGRTEVVSVEPWDGDRGTRVEVTLRGEYADHARSGRCGGLFGWAEESRGLAGGTLYKGKTSAHWYDDHGFWEYLQDEGDVRIESFVRRKLHGCSEKVEEVAGRLTGRTCGSLKRDEATALLKRAKAASRKVEARLLGKVGRRKDFYGYSSVFHGEFQNLGATVPYVVEAWANLASKPSATVCVNRSPVCQKVFLERREGSEYRMFGCDLNLLIAAGRKGCGEFRVVVNVIAPFVPLTSSGKDPSLAEMADDVALAVNKAIRTAKANAPNRSSSKVSQKKFIRHHIKAAAAKLSGLWRYWFSLRQLFYELRPGLIGLIGEEPRYGTFCKVVGKYEDEFGDVEFLYRDDRGTLYHPHTQETIHLGTRSVDKYARPDLVFRSLLVSEKEGLFPALKYADWPELYDCALCTAKGFATKSVLKLIRLIKSSGEPVTVFVIHDADGHGTVIFEVIQRRLERHGITVVNLGLEPAEGRKMELQEEKVTPKKGQCVRVASYVPQEDKEWLQSHRIELNAMTTPQFIEWLSAKIQGYYDGLGSTPKVIPPEAAVREALDRETLAAIGRRMTEEAIRNANIPQRSAAEFAESKAEVEAAGSRLSRELPDFLRKATPTHWSIIVRDESLKIAGSAA